MSEWFSDFKSDFIKCFISKDRWKFLTKGFSNTLIIAIAACIIGIALGVIIALIRSSWDKNKDTMNKGVSKTLLMIANAICRVYLTVIRGTPVVVQLMIMYYVILASSRNGLAVAIAAFGINSGAYVAEIVRSGIMSIDHGQFEAGRSLGLSYVGTLYSIILPQAFKNILPALANEFIVLLKETSIAGYVAIQDLTKGAYIISSTTYEYYLPLLTVAGIYLILVMILSHFVGKLERRLRVSER